MLFEEKRHGKDNQPPTEKEDLLPGGGEEGEQRNRTVKRK